MPVDLAWVNMVDREAVLQELPVYLPDVDLGRVARGSLILLGCLLNLRGRGDGLLVWQAEDLKERGRNVPQVLQLLLLALGLLGKVLAQAAEAVAADFFLQEAGQKRGVEELAGLWHFLKLESQQLTQAHVLAQVGRKQPHGLQLVQGLEQVAQTAIQLLLQKVQGRGISQHLEGVVFLNQGLVDGHAQRRYQGLVELDQDPLLL